MATTYTATSLGREIKKRREQLGLTQEQLGTKAGYAKGAAVAISRIENGKQRPRTANLARIAKALDTTEASLIRRAEVGTTADERQAAARGPLGQRRKKVAEASANRAATIQELGEAYNAEANRVISRFVEPFMEFAESIEERPKTPGKESLTMPSADASAEERIQQVKQQFNRTLAADAGAALGAGLGGLGAGGIGAMGLFTAVGTFGTASTGAAIGALHGIAATNATLAALGGGALAAGGYGIAGGIAVLGGTVALPAVLAAGAVYAVRRQTTQKEASAKVADAERFLDETWIRYDAVRQHLKESVDILRFTGTHASRAVEKWIASCRSDLRSPEIAPRWDDLTKEQRSTHDGLLTIASCLAILLHLDPQLLMTAPSVDHPDVDTLVSDMRQGDEVGDSLSLDSDVAASFEVLSARYSALRTHIDAEVKRVV